MPVTFTHFITDLLFTFSWPVHTISNGWIVNQYAVIPAMNSKCLPPPLPQKWKSFSCKIICHANLLSESPSYSAHDSNSTTVFLFSTSYSSKLLTCYWQWRRVILILLLSTCVASAWNFICKSLILYFLLPIFKQRCIILVEF